MKISKENRNRFDKMFDRSEYERAKSKVERTISSPAPMIRMVELLNGYDVDDEIDDPMGLRPEIGTEPSFYCEVELERDGLETDADYISVEFLIGYNAVSRTGKIDSVRFYAGYPSGEGGCLCAFDPDTCEIAEWFGF